MVRPYIVGRGGAFEGAVWTSNEVCANKMEGCKDKQKGRFHGKKTLKRGVCYFICVLCVYVHEPQHKTNGQGERGSERNKSCCETRGIVE